MKGRIRVQQDSCLDDGGGEGVRALRSVGSTEACLDPVEGRTEDTRGGWIGLRLGLRAEIRGASFTGWGQGGSEGLGSGTSSRLRKSRGCALLVIFFSPVKWALANVYYVGELRVLDNSLFQSFLHLL